MIKDSIKTWNPVCNVFFMITDDGDDLSKSTQMNSSADTNHCQ